MHGGAILFSCHCGQVEGQLEPPADGTHAVCFCNDCRAAVWHLNGEDPGKNGVGYYQTTPDRVTFAQGQDKLGLMTLRKGGLFRWHAICCNAPLFITASRPGIAFASILVDRLADKAALGPVVTRAFVPKRNGKRGHEGIGRFLIGMLGRTVPARLSGRWKQTPFFDIATGLPAATPRALSQREQRAAGLGA